MFGLFVNKKELAAETAKIIKGELDGLRRGLASDVEKSVGKSVEKISSQAASALSSSFSERLSLLNISLGERLSLVNSLFALFGKNASALHSLNASVDASLAGHAGVITSAMDEQLSSMGGALEKKLSELEQQLQQSLRQERRRQMALESIIESQEAIIENQNKTLEALECQETPLPLEALMSLAENFALTKLAASGTLEADIFGTFGILYDKLTNLMDCFELTLISDAGADFDPERHEACGARSEPGRPDNSVLEIVRPGFLLRGKVLRCATVIVNRHDGGEEPAGLENAQ